MDKVPKFKLRGNRLVDAKSVLLGLVAGSGSNWMGKPMAGGGRASDLGRGDGWGL